MKKFVITAGTLTGNRGAEAMVTTCVEKIREIYPEAIIFIASYYPKDDTNELKKIFNNHRNIYISSSTPLKIVFNWFPMAIISKIFPSLKRKKIGKNTSILNLIDADVVLDVAGVSFIDGREKFLPFNILTIFPFLIHNVKVIKLAQAMGPFEKRINKSLSKLVLTKCHKVFARGQKTKNLLNELGIVKNVEYSPDISFSLRTKEYLSYEKRKLNSIAIIPSSLIMSKSKNYIKDMVKLIEWLQSTNVEVTMIIHSWRESSNARNNDNVVANQINASLKKKIAIKGFGLSAAELREEISKFKVVITSRFHAMISSLDTLTPVLVIGWSHKYFEILDQFDLGVEYCLDYKLFDLNNFKNKINFVLKNGNLISDKIKKKLPNIKNISDTNFKKILSDI